MRLHILTSAMLASSMLFGLTGAPAFADDGERLVRSVSSPPGLEEDPEPEGEHAFVSVMNFHVPSQRADGTVEPIVYNNIDGVLVKTEEKAKPLINVYVYGPVDAFEDFSQSGFPGHGRREAFGAVSLDDGETWKNTNLSNSADSSSFTIGIAIPDPGAASTDTPIEVDDPDGATIVEAVWDISGSFGELEVVGEAESRDRVTIRNAVTQEALFVARADRNGDFDVERRLEVAPCYVQAGVDDVFGPAIEVEGAPEDCEGKDVILTDQYPGDATNVFHSTAGNKVLVAWQSKFCSSGFPGYTGGAVSDADTIAAYLGISNEVDLYLTDMFGVAGNQQSVDYREQEEFPGEYAGVGEVPYNCLWTARGVLREDPDAEGTTELVWLQAERLTSGRRDVNRVETKCVAGAGCAVSWQEDPDGLRPGEGEGAGTGWAGATVNSKTDIWYSFIEWEDFDIIIDNGEPFPLADIGLVELGTGRPQPYVPMMVPVRLTNNDRCAFPVNPVDVSYCNNEIAGAYGIKDQCIDTVDIPLGPQDELQPVCVVDANRSEALDTGDLPNLANTGASRPRLNLQPRDSDGDTVVDDAWVVIVLEESKGLGRFPFLNTEDWDGNVDNTGTSCTDETLDTCETDIGKNQWYVSYALGTPQTSVLDTLPAVDADYSMLNNLVAQQNQLNAPEVNWITGTFFPPMSTVDMWEFGDTLNYSIFNTEIARRASLMTQSLAKADASTSKLVAMPLFKEGVINQGGPADIMARRIALPDDWTTEQSANPYAFENLKCEWYDGEGGVTEGTMLYTDGLNPNYPKGLCTAPTINLSNRTPLTCEVTGTGDGVCPTADMTCEDDLAFGQLCLSIVDPENNQTLDKLTSWYECPGASSALVGGTGATVPDCYVEPESDLLQANLDDRSWYMPIDISKAHRGFLDGDFIAMIYAWSPNWKLNAVGTDRYELYTRRSFTGGVTWTTTPGSFVASDGVTYSGVGTTTCETWRDGATSVDDSHVCTPYAAGVPEQSRNLTQHKSMRVTTLDPRFTPTLASMADTCPDWFQIDGVCESEWLLFEPINDDTTLDGDPTDVRNPSRFFVVYETGDNTTVAEGEAEPLNLDYGRAEMFGDHFTVWAETDTDTANLEVCYPNDAHGTTDVDWAVGTGFCNEFDTLEGFPLSLSAEASITSSAYGDFLYGVWGQFNVEEDPDTGEHVFVDGDSMFRRVWYLDDYISETEAWNLPGDAQ